MANWDQVWNIPDEELQLVMKFLIGLEYNNHDWMHSFIDYDSSDLKVKVFLQIWADAFFDIYGTGQKEGMENLALKVQEF